MPSKPYMPLPQHKAREIDDVQRMKLAEKYASGKEMVDEMLENATAIVAQKKFTNAAVERKDTPEEETDDVEA